MEQRTAVYRAFAVDPTTQPSYVFGTAQRVGLANYPNLQSIFNTEYSVGAGLRIRDDIRALAGRKVKSMRMSMVLRGTAGGTILGDVCLVELKAAIVSSASGEIIAAIDADMNGASAIPADARLFYQYTVQVEPASNVTPVLNDTIFFQELTYLEVEYYVD